MCTFDLSHCDLFEGDGSEFRVDLSFRHVRIHTKHPTNEFVDVSVRKAAGDKVCKQPRSIDLAQAVRCGSLAWACWDVSDHVRAGSLPGFLESGEVENARIVQDRQCQGSQIPAFLMPHAACANVRALNRVGGFLLQGDSSQFVPRLFVNASTKGFMLRESTRLVCRKPGHAGAYGVRQNTIIVLKPRTRRDPSVFSCGFINACELLSAVTEDRLFLEDVQRR